MNGRSANLDALHAFARKAFAEWRGLSAPCALEEALRVFEPQSEWIGTGRLGLHAVEAHYRFVRAAAYAEPLRVWFADTGILLVEAEGPIDDLLFPALTSQLGEPEARLDTYFGFSRVEKGEWVYPSRGLALSSDSGGREIHRLWAFAPTTLSGYLEELRVDLKQRPMTEARWNHGRV